MSRISHSRTALMIGAATAALAAMLAVTPASAQTADQVAGARVVTSSQRADHVQALADTSDFSVLVGAPPVDTSDVALRANTVTASVRANQSDSQLALDAADISAQDRVTRLTSGNGGISASGDALLVTVQRGAAATAAATSTGGVIGIYSDTSRASTLALDANRIETQATGNDATAQLSLGALQAPLAGGILGFQANDARSAVVSTNESALRINAGATFGSDIAMTGNLVRALGYGNSLSSDFTVTAANATVAGDAGPASLVPAEGDPSVAAAFASLSHQEQNGSVTARAGGAPDSDPFHLIVYGQLSDSTARHDADAIAAGAYGNRSDNNMTVQASTLSGSGAAANLTGVQRAGDAAIEADALGGIRTNILGTASGSQLSLSNNEARAVAVANLAEGNQLDVAAAGIDTLGLPGSGPVGTASTGTDDSSSVTAAFSVQNVQDFGQSTIGAQTTSALKLGVLGPVEQSTLAADGNRVSAGATGNAATNSLSLAAPLLRTSADLNNVQSGQGGIRVRGGDSVEPLGVMLALPATVLASDLSVRDNALSGTAIGNSASSTMRIEGASLANGSGHDAAVSGPLSDGYGAAADYALASSQTLGLSGAEGDAVVIGSKVAGRFGMLGDSRAYGSTYRIEGNGTASTVAGNTVANHLSVDAAGLGADGVPAPGSALSSAQYAQLTSKAQSIQMLIAPGSLDGSAVSVKDNANQAYAVVNEADNLLSVAASKASTLTGRMPRAEIGSTTEMSGDGVLGNLQFAGGSITADAVTTVVNGDAGIGLASSRFAIDGNATTAEATANRAKNAVEIDSIGGGTMGGLGSMQTSTASVAATASFDGGYRASPLATPMIDASSVAITDNSVSALARGNAADNQLQVRGGASMAAPGSAEVGRYDSWAEAGAPLLNVQTNYGGVTASADSLVGAAFNGPLAGMNQASVAVTGSSVSAAAYGNSASNMIGLSSPARPQGAALVSSQVNYGPVSALAVGSQLTLPLSTLSGSSVALSGNKLSAVAIGNQATNSITGPR